MFFRYELKIERNQITFTPLIGKKRSFTFDQITKVKIESIQYGMGKAVNALNGKKRLFWTNSSHRGYNLLVSRLKKELPDICMGL